MNIYEVMEGRMRSFDKQKGHLSTQLQGIVETIVEAWDTIPEPYPRRLYNAAVAAAEAFGMQKAPPYWMEALTKRFIASQKPAQGAT